MSRQWYDLNFSSVVGRHSMVLVVMLFDLAYILLYNIKKLSMTDYWAGGCILNDSSTVLRQIN